LKDRLSLSTTLRGYVNFNIRAKIANNNMHSGIASGVAPNPFHILMAILARIYDPKT